jgi:hypothetical protein
VGYLRGCEVYLFVGDGDMAVNNCERARIPLDFVVEELCETLVAANYDVVFLGRIDSNGRHFGKERREEKVDDNDNDTESSNEKANFNVELGIRVVKEE